MTAEWTRGGISVAEKQERSRLQVIQTGLKTVNELTFERRAESFRDQLTEPIRMYFDELASRFSHAIYTPSSGRAGGIWHWDFVDEIFQSAGQFNRLLLQDDNMAEMTDFLKGQADRDEYKCRAGIAVHEAKLGGYMEKDELYFTSQRRIDAMQRAWEFAPEEDHQVLTEIAAEADSELTFTPRWGALNRVEMYAMFIQQYAIVQRAFES